MLFKSYLNLLFFEQSRKSRVLQKSLQNCIYTFTLNPQSTIAPMLVCGVETHRRGCACVSVHLCVSLYISVGGVVQYMLNPHPHPRPHPFPHPHTHTRPPTRTHARTHACTHTRTHNKKTKNGNLKI